jgi:hypothetical protein
MASLRQDIDTFNWLVQHREPYEDTIEEIKELMLPWRFELDTSPDPNRQKIGGSFDSMAAVEADKLVNFVVGNVFPPSGDWARLYARGAEDDRQLQSKLDEATEEVLSMLAESNFYQQASLALRDLVIIGNAYVYMEPRPAKARDDGTTFNGLDFEAVPFNRVWRLVDRKGEPLIVARKFCMRAFEAEQFFTRPGDSFSFKGDPMEEIDFIHMIRREKDGSYPSRWIRMDVERSVRQAKMSFMPYAISRWDVVDGEQYGVGRGHLARPTAAGRNELKRQILMAAGRDLGPSLMVEHDSIMNVDRAAHGLLVLKPSVVNRPEYLQSQTNYQAAQQVAMEDAEQIRSAFLTDLIGEPDGIERSAEGVRVRQARMVQAAASPAQNISTNFLRPIIQSTVNLMRAGGMLEMLDGIEDNVELAFVSPFFTLQKQQAVQKVADFLGFKAQLQQLAQRDDLLDDVDFDKASAYISDNSDIPAFILKNPEEIRQARAELAAMDKALQAQKMLGEGQGGMASPEQPAANVGGGLPGNLPI